MRAAVLLVCFGVLFAIGSASQVDADVEPAIALIETVSSQPGSAGSGSAGLRPVPSVSGMDGSASAAPSASSITASSIGSSQPVGSSQQIPVSSVGSSSSSVSGGSSSAPSSSGSTGSSDSASDSEEEEEADTSALDGIDGDEITNSDAWVKKMIKRYTGGAKKGKVKGKKGSSISIVGNSNTLRKEETADTENDEELFKKTQEEIRKQTEEQKSKRADEDKIKKAEDNSKQRVIMLKKLAKEEQLKQDQEQDEKTAAEERQKADEATRKKEGEQAQKDKVAQAQRDAQAEHERALAVLEGKKKEEAKEKDEMRKKTEQEVAEAKAAAQREREAAAARLAQKKAEEAKTKKEEQEREEATKAAEKKKQIEEENKAADRKAAQIHPNAFNPQNGRVIAEHGRLWPTRQWTGSYTYTFWVRPTGIRGGWANLFHKGAENHHRNPAVWFYPGQTRLHIRSGATQNPTDWGGYTNYGCDPGDHLPQNQWTWVAFSHQPGQMNVYYGDVNGNLRHVCQIGYPGPVQNTGPLYAGDPWHEQPFASMADLRVYNRALSQKAMLRVLKEKVGVA